MNGMEISAEQILGTMNNPSDLIHIRIIDDKKKGIFAGAKITVELGKFSSIEKQLKEHNSMGRGIHFVVNYGGDDDKSITRINAHFFEMDEGSFEEQLKKVDDFPLRPSFIIQTKRSLHVYYLTINAKTELFRPIQKALVDHFNGDPACVNESRCMRLPGFYHCKTDTPVMVKCIRFAPENKYTQEELIEALPEYVAPKSDVPKDRPAGSQKGLNMVLSTCDFMQHFVADAATLSEPEWYAGITNLAVFEGGREKIHEFSAPYPEYDEAKTDDKIDHFLKSKTGPITCETLAEKGYVCPKRTAGKCSCKAPAAKCFEPLTGDELQDLLLQIPVKGDVISDMQTAQKFVSDFLFNVDLAVADIFIRYNIKDHFHFKAGDMKPVLELYKQKAKEHKAEAVAAAQKRQSQTLPEWYEMGDRGPKFLPDVLADYCAENKDVFFAAEDFYIYENGCYRVLREENAKNMVRELMLRGYIKYSQITDSTLQWKMQIQKDSKDLNTNPYLLNLRNGVYNILEKKLMSHSPKFLTTVQLCVNYTPGADCPRFKKFLSEQLEADQIPLVQEILGYFLVPVQRAQKCFVIVGEAAAGKSVLLRVINEVLLGRENVSNVSWQALNERFKPAELFGKLANIFADLPTKNIDDNGIFKALVGEDFLTVERKNKDPFSFQSYARLLFSCNTIPRNYGDKSEGFYRRLIIIRFKHAVPTDKRDPELLEKFRTEADGIFLFALEGLRRLMNNGYRFSETEANAMELKKYREDSDSILSFLNECCILEEGAEEARVTVYERYVKYCKDGNLNPYSKQKFNAELESSNLGLVKAVDKTGNRRTWRGLRPDDDFDG